MAGGIGVEDDLKQVAGIQAEDGATVGANVADPLQPGLQPFHRIERRRKDDVVDLSGLTTALVNVADLAAQHEAHRRVAGRRRLSLNRGRQIGLQPIQSILGWRQLLAHLCQPARMGDVARPDDMDPLELRPARQVLEGQIRAGGAGKVRVDVEIGDEFHAGEYSTGPEEAEKQRHVAGPRHAPYKLRPAPGVYRIWAPWCCNRILHRSCKTVFMKHPSVISPAPPNDLTLVSVKRSLLGKLGGTLLSVGRHLLRDQRWLTDHAGSDAQLGSFFQHG